MEVTCTQCSATLSLPDHAAGKKAKCPRCETVFTVPEATSLAATAQQPAEAYFKPERHDAVACPGCERWLAYSAELAGKTVICPSCNQRARMPSAPAERPDLTRTRPSSTTRPNASWPASVPPSQPLNPYAQPTINQPTAVIGYSPAMPNYEAAGWVMTIMAGIMVLLTIFSTGIISLALVAGNQKPDEFASTIFQLVWSILQIGVQAVILASGVRMIQRRNLKLTRTGAVLSMIPCFGCCLIQLPVGIWATILLFNAEATRHFED